MKYTAEDYISFIEQGRKDKISPHGLELISKRFRELENDTNVDSVVDDKEIVNWRKEFKLNNIFNVLIIILITISFNLPNSSFLIYFLLFLSSIVNLSSLNLFTKKYK